MGSGGDEFFISGPTHMMVNTAGGSSSKKVIDWDNLEQRRCITACLVKGTYVLEKDENKLSDLAPAWWESFHFRKGQVLRSACQCILCMIFGPNTWFICGVVFEYVPPEGTLRHPKAPRYIVAFRGTMPRDATAVCDMRLNLRIVLNKQHLCVRFNDARNLVENLVRSTGDGSGSDVWLAGHSLGASIALEVGREMMVSHGLSLRTFLFNPPHVSLAPAANLLGMSEKAKQVVSFGSSAVKHALGKTILKPQKERMEAMFDKLAPWTPELFVHQRDIICSGFIEDLELREHTRERHPSIAKSAATLSYRDFLHPCAVNGFGAKKGRLHLLPAARLWKNSSPNGKAHELRQWWQPGLILTSKLYSWP